MKKTLLCIGVAAYICVDACSSVQAQSFPIDRGAKVVTGSFVFSSTGGDLYEILGERIISIQLNPVISYFVTPGLAVGGKFLFARVSQGSTSLSTWGIGPQIAYFIGGRKSRRRAKGATYPYVAVSLLYVLHEEPSYYGSDPYGNLIVLRGDASGTAISAGFGVAHMLSNTVGLLGEVGYQIDHMKYDGGESQSGNTFSTALGIAAFLH